YIVTAVIDSGAKVQTLEQNAGADWSLEYGSAPHRYTRFASEATTYLIPPIGGSDMIEDTQRHYDIINREWINSTGREFTWKEFRVNFVGKDKLEALLIIHSSPETAKWQKLATLGQKADKEGWVKPTESDKKLVQIKKIIG
ncbi:hypothetical protein, partial [Rhodococcus erythropolis]|uniref:hypothetical protein n=1 Tax=Rhodococcus erythropolis TaxID=1833 RepID=UPI0030140AF8